MRHKIRKYRKNLSVMFLTAALTCRMTVVLNAQVPADRSVTYEKRITITVENPLPVARKGEAVSLPVSALLKQAPDFNRRFFRLKHPPDGFEPLDVPMQIVNIPGRDETDDLVVFRVDLGPGERKNLELLYNPEGIDEIEYPPETQASDIWYRPGTTLAWENTLVAYRSYNGIVDFFGKTYPHLRLHDMPNDTYHHERLWGVDPYLVGGKSGIGGIVLVTGDKKKRCYGSGDINPLTYSHRAFEGGAVAAGGTVTVIENSRPILNTLYILYSGHHENDVRTWMTEQNEDWYIAPGMQTFDNADILLEEEKGYLIVRGRPVEEYGTIGTALVWNPEECAGTFKTDDGIFVMLRPAGDNGVHYLSMAVWNRASADQPESSQALRAAVEELARCFKNPVSVTVHNN